MAVRGTPFRITRKVWPADAVSDHGGTVRFAGEGFIPSRRCPLPSALAPWQMTQLAAKIAAPACWAAGDASNPAGALGAASRSHPEMTSEIVNRAIPVDRIRVPDHVVAKALHLADDGCDKFIQFVGNDA
jgi:hypothetical protein